MFNSRHDDFVRVNLWNSDRRSRLHLIWNIYIKKQIIWSNVCFALKSFPDLQKTWTIPKHTNYFIYTYGLSQKIIT